MIAYDPEKITFFAKTDARGQNVAFGIKAKDRQRHMYVVGKTGMGKSTLLENMAAQDIQNGEGMAFIDPHGSAAETLLLYVPEHRVKDVVYFAPFDLDHPISFNVMEDVGHDKRHLVVSGLMSTFKKIWVDAWSARMEYILTNALLALIEYPDTTLLSVNRLFVDKKFREQVVDYIQDPAVKAFWKDEFANYTDRFTAEALPAIQNKIGQFTGNPLIRNIIGQPHSSFDIRQIMDEKKILIMNLSKGLIGETNANLLGSMLTTRIYLAAMSRADLPLEKMRQMPNFYFYVDEFQSFANATFANILSEARKYHLNLIIAHQYIEQMEEDVRNAVFGNVGTTIAFRVGPFDAEVLETVFSPRFLATDLVNLGFAQIYLTLMIDGIGSTPFSAQTLPPVQLPPISCREMVIDASRKAYTKERLVVEKIVADLHTPAPKTAADNKKSFDKRPPIANDNANVGANNRNSQVNNFNNRPPSARAPDAPRPVVKATDRPRDNSFHGTVNSNKVDTNLPTTSYKPSPKPAEQQKSPEELRRILAKLAEGENAAKISNQVTVQKAETIEVKTPAPRPPVESGNRAELKNALAEVLKRAESLTVKQETVQTVANTASQPPKQTFTDRPPVASLSNIRKVEVEHRQRPVFKRVREVESTESSQADAPQTNLPDSTLDPSLIKRMLRHNDQERSPFN